MAGKDISETLDGLINGNGILVCDEVQYEKAL